LLLTIDPDLLLHYSLTSFVMALLIEGHFEEVLLLQLKRARQ